MITLNWSSIVSCYHKTAKKSQFHEFNTEVHNIFCRIAAMIIKLKRRKGISRFNDIFRKYGVFSANLIINLQKIPDDLL